VSVPVEPPRSLHRAAAGAGAAQATREAREEEAETMTDDLPFDVPCKKRGCRGIKHPLIPKFLAFHAEHPDVFEQFQRLTFQMVEHGRHHYSAEAICHALRWFADLSSSPEADEFKLNNNFAAFYGRLFCVTHPQHREFFRCKHSLADHLYPNETRAAG
jgi:hypothetical protein